MDSEEEDVLSILLLILIKKHCRRRQIENKSKKRSFLGERHVSRSRKIRCYSTPKQNETFK